MKENGYQGYTIIENKDLDIDMSMGAYKCYVVLTRMCQNKDNCYPSQETLAKKLRRTVRTVQRYIKELVEHNLIKITRRGSTSNLYTIVAKIGKQVANNIKERVDKIIKNNTKTNGQKSPIEGQLRNKQSYSKSKNQFGNYEQRSTEYYLKFEKQLLGWE